MQKIVNSELSEPPLNPICLHKKFNSSILNYQTEGPLGELRKKLDAAFNENTNIKNSQSVLGGKFQSLLEKKPYIMTHPDLKNWVIKAPRTDSLQHRITPDTNAYRVRKALRIKNIIKEKGLTEVVVPEKYLYELNHQLYVIAQDIEHNPIIFEEKPMNIKAVSEIATLCFDVNLDDAVAYNLAYTKEGKIALLDTEPINRYRKKALWILIVVFPYLRSNINYCLSCYYSEFLYPLADNDEKKQTLRKIQNGSSIKHLTKLFFITTLSCISLIGCSYALIITSVPILKFIFVIASIIALSNTVFSIGCIGLSLAATVYARSDRHHKRIEKGW